MKVHYHRDGADRLVGIARNAGLTDWLLGLGRRRPRPQALPRHLHADLGLPPHWERGDAIPR